MPVFGVSPLFATVLPVGFAGGHGTAGGLTPTYKTVSIWLVTDELITCKLKCQDHIELFFLASFLFSFFWASCDQMTTMSS